MATYTVLLSCDLTASMTRTVEANSPADAAEMAEQWATDHGLGYWEIDGNDPYDVRAVSTTEVYARCRARKNRRLPRQ